VRFGFRKEIQRPVFEPYAREVFEETLEWIAAHGIFADGAMGSGNYKQAVMTAVT
jgi:hypothetical protein